MHLTEGDLLQQRDRLRAKAERDVTFVGRLGTCCCMDTDITICAALDVARAALVR